MKRIFAILLIVAMLLCCTGCGGSAYGVRSVQTLVDQEYSIAFRPGDTTYTYMAAMLQYLAYEGKVDELAVKWLGERIINFDKDPSLMEQIGMPEPKTIIIGAAAVALSLLVVVLIRSGKKKAARSTYTPRH